MARTPKTPPADPTASSLYVQSVDKAMKVLMAFDGSQRQLSLSDIAAHPEVDVVMAAIVGAAGLAPCLAAARAGKRLLLANKEALVVGGALFMDAVEKGGATLLPIDSEHSAIFQCLPEDRRSWPRRIDHIVLTASGGPFRTRDPASLRDGQRERFFQQQRLSPLRGPHRQLGLHRRRHREGDGLTTVEQFVE